MDKQKFVCPDCAGFVKLETGNRCLRRGKCNCFNCKSYQSRADYEETLEKCRKRLCGLSQMEQEYIAEKYYEGKKIWYNGGIK